MDRGVCHLHVPVFGAWAPRVFSCFCFRFRFFLGGFFWWFSDARCATHHKTKCVAFWGSLVRNHTALICVPTVLDLLWGKLWRCCGRISGLQANQAKESEEDEIEYTLLKQAIAELKKVQRS